MLFCQVIRYSYDKRQRSGDSMRRISDVRFLPVPEPISGLSEKVYLRHISGQKKPVISPVKDRLQVTERVYAEIQGKQFRVIYSHSPAKPFFKPVFTLDTDQYGRIVYSERVVTIDGEWRYIRTTGNLLNAPADSFRSKMFFRKEPDYLFTDMAKLRYCGLV